MARKTRGRPSFPVKKKAGFRRRYRTTRSALTTNRPPNPLVKCARSLIGMLPFGQAYVKPLADFIFKGFGLTEIADSNKPYYITFFMTGCVNMIKLNPLMTLAFTDYCSRNEQSDIIAGAQVTTPVATVQMVSLTVKVASQSKISDKQGKWAAAVIPFKNENSETDLDKYKDKTLTYRDVTQLPYARFGPTHAPLTVGFKFNNSSDYCSRDLNINQNYCAIVVAFEDLAREAYTKITTDEFAADIDVSTVFRIKSFVCNRMPNQAGYTVQPIYDGSKQISAIRTDKKDQKLLEYKNFAAVSDYLTLELTTAYTRLEDYAMAE